MQFKILALLAVTLPFSWAQTPDPEVLVTKLSGLTRETNDADKSFKDVNSSNPLGTALTAIGKLRAVSVSVTLAASALASGAPFAEDDQRYVCASMSQYLGANQRLLKTLFDQKPVLTVYPVENFIRAVPKIIAALKRDLGKLVLSNVRLVPVCAVDFGKQLQDVLAEYDLAIGEFPSFG